MMNPPVKKRSIWIWIISLYFFIPSLIGLISYSLFLVGVFQPVLWQQFVFEKFTILLYVSIFLLLFANLFGGIALFFLRKISIYFFFIALILFLFVQVLYSHTIGWEFALTYRLTFTKLITVVILIAVCWYSCRLAKNRILT